MKIKFSFIVLVLSNLVFSGHLTAQGVAVSNDGNYLPASSAILDVMATDKGILIPRLSTAQREAIYQPANGLLVFDSDKASFLYFDGAAWRSLASKNYVDSIKQEIKLEIWAEIGVDDTEGHHYPAVKIGSQVWMALNLRATRYSDGSPIPRVTDNTAWSLLSTPAFCWYMNDSSTYAALCGAMYNWYAVNSGILCPEGWHVPSDAEWTILTDYLGGVSLAGGKMKEAGTTHWLSPNTGASNSSGFTAIPGGFRHNGSFWDYGYNANWWSSSDHNSTESWARKIFYYSGTVLRDVNHMNIGFSVRCLKN
jgi:uncharacterized protein (TIGR02145 family)